MSDEELERLARKAGLLECIDDAYLARGDWMPEAREFASLAQSAERERCAEENKNLRQEVSRLRKDEFLQELDGRAENEWPISRLRRDARATVADLIDCCISWEPDVCILGNVRAGDAAKALQNLLESAEEQSHRALIGQTKKLYAGAMEFWRRALSLSNENKKLRAFAQSVMDAWPEGGIEGDDLQEIAAKHGLLAPELRFDPCWEWCNCNAGVDVDGGEWERGVECYRRTALLTGAEE